MRCNAILIVLSLALFLIACHDKNVVKEPEIIKTQSAYNVRVNYLAKNDSIVSWPDSKFPKDSLYLTSEFYFASMDEAPDSLTIRVYKNGELFHKEVYDKNSLGVEGRDFVCFGLLKNVNTVGIRINNGGMAYVEPDSVRHVIRAMYKAETKELKVDYLKAMPEYR